MANRAQRRQMMRQQTQKNKALIADYSKQERVKGLIQNGITAKDLEEAFTQGHNEGFMQAGLSVLRCCYAAICIALHDEFGFGESRCFRALKVVDEKVALALNHEELVDEAFEKTGLTLSLDEPFERIQKREKKGRTRE